MPEKKRNENFGKRFYCFPSSSSSILLVSLLLLLLLLLNSIFPLLLLLLLNSIVLPPPPPQFYCSPSSSSSSSILLFSLLLLLLLNSIVLPPPLPPPQFYCSPSSSSSYSSSILLFSLLLLNYIVLNHRHRHHNSLKNCKPVSLVQSAIMSQVVKNNPGFLQLLAHCPTHQCEFLLRTATPQQVHALVQVLHNVLKEYIPFPKENRQKLLPYKDALISLAEPHVPYKKKKHILVQEGGGFIQDLLPPVISSLGFLLL